MPERDTWNRYELPALTAIADAFAAGRPSNMLMGDELLAGVGATGADRATWVQALDRLQRAGYIEAERLDQGTILIYGLTERGLRAAGVWPAQERLLDDLAGLLEAEAARLDEAQPERATRLRLAGQALLKVAAEVGPDLVVKFAARLAGMA